MKALGVNILCQSWDASWKARFVGLEFVGRWVAFGKETVVDIDPRVAFGSVAVFNEHVGDAPVQLCRNAAVWVGHTVALAALMLPYGRTGAAASVTEPRGGDGRCVEEMEHVCWIDSQDIQPIGGLR